ncbi:MAG TPA: TonB-dependent receptor [Prolixibacteraceae bacterium]|nr:TonB-dependent receptor [Prolixibacteraceae bacterium]
MKLTAFLIILFTLQVTATVYSQNKKLSLNMQGNTIKEVLQQIEAQSEYRFIYENEKVNLDTKVSIRVTDEVVEKILKQLFEKDGVSYSITENNLILINPSGQQTRNIGKEFNGIQQQKSVSGKVTDSSGSSLPGVSVVVKGTTAGVITDMDGKYTLTKVPLNATLLFSFVGMKTQEVVVGNNQTINVILTEEAIGLDEVVAIGYGTQQKATVTGSVVSTKGDDLIKSKTPNVLNSLTGRLPGVIVNNRSGEPGRDDPTILIRGKSTTGSSSPLILIDGIETSDFGRINPNDIESMSVLKDASAAIYGARAANGVILVTTKSGKKGTPSFNFDYNQGFSQPTRNPKMADSYTFAKVYNEIEIGEGRSAKYSEAELEKYRIGKEVGYTTTDWYDVMTKSLTPQHLANMSVAGGTESLDYYISLGQLSQDGNFNYGTTNLERYNFRSKINVKLNEYIKAGLDVSGRYDDKHYPGNPDARGIYSHIFLYRPDWTLFWPGTDYLRPNRDSESLVNWVSDNSGWQKNKYKALESKLHFDIIIPWVKGLSVSGSATYESGYNYIKQFAIPDYVYYYNSTTNLYTKGRSGYGSNLASLNENFNQSSKLTINSQINYTKTIGSHKIDLMAGYEQMKYDYNYFSAYRTDFPSSALPQLFAGSSDKNKQGNSGSASSTSRQNYFGRATYDYRGKYLAQLIFRYDGSPNFPENKRWGLFPGISLGWRLSEESFMKQFSFLQNLKIRGSYGELGNDAVSAFQYLTSYAYNNNYVLGNTDVIGLVQSGVANPNITWEVAKSTNIGFDATLWNGGLSIEFDAFKTRRSNILTKRTAVIPDYTGLVLPDENVGIVENKGFELQLTHQKKVNSDLRYSISGNMSFARNKVIYADEAPASESYQLATGRPIGAELFYDAIGIFKDQAQVDATPHLAGAKPGDIIYRDVNGDKQLNSRDMVRINQTPTPEIVYSFIGSVSFKDFDLSVVFQGQENASTYVKGGSGVTDTNPYFSVMSYNLGNFLQWRADNRWSPDHTVATQPRGSIDNFNNNTLQSTHWLLDAGFLRLKNLELGYNLPSGLCHKIGMKKLRTYVSGNNLAIIYDHMKKIGFDPETSDFWYYPQQRTFNVGVNLTF